MGEKADKMSHEKKISYPSQSIHPNNPKSRARSLFLYDVTEHNLPLKFRQDKILFSAILTSSLPPLLSSPSLHSDL